MSTRIRTLGFVALLLSAAGFTTAQTIREQVLDPVEHSAGSSMAYRFEASPYTAPPAGYEPFYISHFGRHGSRYHTAANLYKKFYELFAEALRQQVLTPLGRRVKLRMDTIYAVCDGRAGLLTPRGEEEHRELAARMYRNYPEVFRPDGRKKRKKVFSRSTAVGRVIRSMQAFDASLRACDSTLEIEEAPPGRYNAYLNPYTRAYKEYYRHGAWHTVYETARERWLSPDRLIGSLFADSVFVEKHMGGRRNFMTEFFAVASILQDCPLDVTLYDLFTDEEIFSLWRLQNLDQYLRKGPSAIGGELAASIAEPLLRDFLQGADEAVAGAGVAADLRFGHGEGLMPLAALMKLDGACMTEADPEKVENVWNDFRITPMAGNIQWIFYRNRCGDILVKFLLNERETTIPLASDTSPYYRWRDVRRFYSEIVKE